MTDSLPPRVVVTAIEAPAAALYQSDRVPERMVFTTEVRIFVEDDTGHGGSFLSRAADPTAGRG